MVWFLYPTLRHQSDWTITFPIDDHRWLLRRVGHQSKKTQTRAALRLKTKTSRVYSHDCIYIYSDNSPRLIKDFRMESVPDDRPHIQPAKVEFDYMAVAPEQRRDRMLQYFTDSKRKWVERCRRDNRDDPGIYNAILRLVEEAKEVICDKMFRTIFVIKTNKTTTSSRGDMARWAKTLTGYTLGPGFDPHWSQQFIIVTRIESAVSMA